MARTLELVVLERQGLLAEERIPQICQHTHSGCPNRAMGAELSSPGPTLESGAEAMKTRTAC